MEKHECLWEEYSQELLLEHLSSYMHLWRVPRDPIWMCINKNYRIEGLPSWSDRLDGEPIAQERYIGGGKWA